MRTSRNLKSVVNLPQKKSAGGSGKLRSDSGGKVSIDVGSASPNEARI